MSEGFIISVGGSGTKVMECLLHMLAIGGNRQQWPQTLHILIVETDNGNGNLRRLTALAEEYRSIQSNIHPSMFFNTKIKLYHWEPVIQGQDNENCLVKYIDGNPNAGLLSDLLFTEDEINHTIDVGFQGHPSLGVVFMEKLLREAEADATAHKIARLNEFHSFWLAVQNAVAQNAAENGSDDATGYGAPRVMVVGSCFGGTGATGIPLLKRYVCEKLKIQVKLGLLMMLPTFSLPSIDNSSDMNIHSQSFCDKVKTVLAFYEEGELLTENHKKAYDVACLLGYPQPVSFETYALGKETQENPATFFDWFGCVSINQFFRTDDYQLHQGLYVSAVNGNPWDFNRMSNVFPSLELDITLMLQAADFFLDHLYKPLENLTRSQINGVATRPKVILRTYSVLNEFFEDWDSRYGDDVSRVYRPFFEYTQKFTDWVFQLLTHVPVDYPEEISTADLARFHMCDEAFIANYFRENEISKLRAMTSQNFVRAPFILHMKRDALDNLVPDGANRAKAKNDHTFGVAQALINALTNERLLEMDKMTNISSTPEIKEERLFGDLWLNGQKRGEIDSSKQSCVALIRSLLQTVAKYHQVQ